MNDNEFLLPSDSAESGLALLERSGIATLRKLCGGQPLCEVVWQRKNGKGKRERIVRRVGYHVWMRWEAFGSYPPRGTSIVRTIGEVIREWEPVLNCKSGCNG